LGFLGLWGLRWLAPVGPISCKLCLDTRLALHRLAPSSLSGRHSMQLKAVGPTSIHSTAETSAPPANFSTESLLAPWPDPQTFTAASQALIGSWPALSLRPEAFPNVLQQIFF